MKDRLVKAHSILFTDANQVIVDNALITGRRFLIQGSYPAEVPLSYQTAFCKRLRDSHRSVLSLLEAQCSPDDTPEIYQLLSAGQDSHGYVPMAAVAVSF
jgi:hypothetical protein